MKEVKHCERSKKFRETVNLKKFYRNQLDKTCFACDAAYSDGKDLAKKTFSEKRLKEKVLKWNEIAKNPTYDGCQRALASIIYNLFNRKIREGASINEEKQKNYINP